MVKLEDSTIEALMATLEDASPEKIKRAKLMVENNSKISQEVKDKYITAIDVLETSEENSTEAPVDLVDALAVKGMDEYIASVKKEAREEGIASVEVIPVIKDEATLAAEKEAEEAKKKEDDEKSAKDAEEAADEHIKDVLIDSIAHSAISLRDEVINLEDIEGSTRAYKESLKEKSTDDLKKLFKDFSTKMEEVFINTPLESLDNETLSEDSPNGLEEEEKNKGTKSPAQMVVDHYLDSK